jgi:hypothetical protein
VLPAGIAESLVQYGFEKCRAESFITSDVTRFSGRYADMTGMVGVSDLTRPHDAVAVQQQVWGGDMSGQLATW